MKTLYRFLLLFTILLFSRSQADASHLTGGEITWECISSGSNQGKFIFRMKLYCACFLPSANCPSSSGTIVNPLYSKYGGPSSITCARILNKEVSTPCYADSLSIKCGLTIAQGGIQAMDENIYESAPIQINGVPESGGSEFYWTSCCRAPTAMLNNVLTGGYYLRAIMYPYTVPGNSSPESLGATTKGPTCYDSSPKFAALPNITICLGDQGTLNNGSMDGDCDVNKYLWAEPMMSATNGVTYKTGYGIYNQLPDSNFHPNNTGGILDTATGIISYRIDSFPNMSIVYHTVCTKIQSFRNGQLISEVYRDMVYPILDCNLNSGGVSNSNSPTVEIKEASSPTYLTNFNKIYPIGNSIELDIRMQDFDTLMANPLSMQSVSLEIYGEAMSDKVNNTTSCDITPCAYLDSNNLAWKNDIFIDTSSLVVRFKWTPECKHVKHKTNAACGAVVGDYEFTIVARDNWCPVPRTTTKKFYITINDTAGVSMKIDTLDAGNSGTYIGWNNYLPANFKNYNVFRKSAVQSSPWVQIATITNQSQSYYQDPYVHPQGLYDFYHVRTNSGAGCLYEDALNTLGLQSNQSGNYVALNWNSAYIKASANPTGTYKVYRQDSTSSVWNLIKTQPYGTTSYLDVNPLINVLMKYKVEANDSYKLHAVSNVSSITITKTIDTSSSVNAVIPENLKPLVYPNPMVDNLTIEMPTNYSLDVLSVNGQEVGHYDLTEGKHKIDVSHFREGLYFLKFSDEKRRVHLMKIIKNDK